MRDLAPEKVLFSGARPRASYKCNPKCTYLAECTSCDPTLTMAMASPHVLKIAVSGAAGNIGYALLPLLANGHVFGRRSVELRLLEITQALPSLEGTRMELLDCAFPSLAAVTCTADPLVAFADADVIVLVGGAPRKKGMARKDLIQKNTSIFVAMGRAIGAVAAPTCKVLVVANPANTNCLVALSEATRGVGAARALPARNFVALTFLDHQRARGHVARRLAVPVTEIRNVTVWGNHSETQFPDVLTDGSRRGQDGEWTPLASALGEDAGTTWATTDLVAAVQQRGKAVIAARGSSSALSAAAATAECLRVWLVAGTAAGETVSMAVHNDKGYYGVREGLVFSFPCECRDGEWRVKEGLSLSSFAQRQLKITEAELLEEREAAWELVAATSS